MNMEFWEKHGFLKHVPEYRKTDIVSALENQRQHNETLSSDRYAVFRRISVPMTYRIMMAIPTLKSEIAHKAKALRTGVRDAYLPQSLDETFKYIPDAGASWDNEGEKTIKAVDGIDDAIHRWITVPDGHDLLFYGLGMGDNEYLVYYDFKEKK